MMCDKCREQRALYLPLLPSWHLVSVQPSTALQPTQKEVVLTRKNVLQKKKFRRNCWRTNYLMFLTTLIVTVKMSDSSIIGNRQNKIVHPLPSYSDSEQSANESDDDDETLDSTVSTWVKTDKTPNLGPFTGNPGVKQIPPDLTKVSQVTGLFLGDTFFDMLCDETNLHSLQNQENYVTGSKGLKWSDVTVAEMKKNH